MGIKKRILFNPKFEHIKRSRFPDTVVESEIKEEKLVDEVALVPEDDSTRLKEMLEKQNKEQAAKVQPATVKAKKVKVSAKKTTTAKKTPRKSKSTKKSA